MQTYENERVIQQGEDWNLDIKLSQSISEYIPYIVSSQREHPHFVLTVASTKFEKNHRYVESWWQEIPDTQPRFKQTIPFYVGEFEDHPTSFDNLKALAKAYDNIDISSDKAYERLYQYTLKDNPNEFEYCYKDNDGALKLGYELYVRFNILSYLPNYKGIKGGTSQWNAQEYMYSITLVSGQLMSDTIAEAIDNYATLNWRIDLPKRKDYPSDDAGYELFRNAVAEILKNETIKEDVFNFIKLHIPDFFQKDIDWNSNLGRIWSPIPILKPTKLKVDSNLRVLI
jgi:hypothetical protein